MTWLDCIHFLARPFNAHAYYEKHQPAQAERALRPLSSPVPRVIPPFACTAIQGFKIPFSVPNCMPQRRFTVKSVETHAKTRKKVKMSTKKYVSNY